MAEAMTDERLAMIRRLHGGSVPGSIGETMHRLAAALLAAREALRVADALADALDDFVECPDHAQNVGWCQTCVANVRTFAALRSAAIVYRAARGARAPEEP